MRSQPEIFVPVFFLYSFCALIELHTLIFDLEQMNIAYLFVLCTTGNINLHVLSFIKNIYVSAKYLLKVYVFKLISDDHFLEASLPSLYPVIGIKERRRETVLLQSVSDTTIPLSFSRTLD